MTKRILSIDPGHSDWCVAWLVKEYRHRFEPECYCYLEGKEKSGVIGCPELCHSIYETLGHLQDWTIIIEEPRTFKNMRPLISLNRDIGYIACRFKESRIVLCQASHWKKYLESLEFLPPKSGNMAEDNYKTYLNAYFNMDLSSHAWAAFGICLWGGSNDL